MRLIIAENVMSKSTLKIGDFVRKQIRKNKSPAKIIAKCQKRDNGQKVNSKHIAWYAWDMRRESSNHYLAEMPSKYRV